MTIRGEVLVAIINNLPDFALARDQHWYRIPVSSVNKWLQDSWPPKWLALYQTKIFGPEAYAVNYYARVLDIHQFSRWQLFPDQPHDDKGNRRYYKLFLEPLRRLPRSIFSRRRRRIVFIPTTWQSFMNAVELNDLYQGSSLENLLWTELKHLQIKAEREELVSVKRRNYFLDFAVYCQTGNLDLETDGDLWHANPEKAAQDNIRDNHLETVGWRVLRFTAHQIQEQMVDYCIPTIVENIKNLDGLESKLPTRKIDLDAPGGSYQPSLFDQPEGQ
jgi:very-short-patch-repair endonuclease